MMRTHLGIMAVVLLALGLLVGCGSAGSGNATQGSNAPVADEGGAGATEEASLSKQLIGTWDAIGMEGEGEFVEMELNTHYTFKEDGTVVTEDVEETTTDSWTLTGNVLRIGDEDGNTIEFRENGEKMYMGSLDPANDESGLGAGHFVLKRRK